MKDFVKLLIEQPEITTAKSYIQSGNFVINSTLKTPKELSDLLINLIFNTYKYNITAISYTVTEFKNILNNYPFVPEDKKDYFTFLTDVPNTQEVTNFIQKTDTSDEFKIDGDIIYIKYATKYSDSKLNNNYFEKQLKTNATTRNLNTVNKLVELSANIS